MHWNRGSKMLAVWHRFRESKIFEFASFAAGALTFMVGVIFAIIIACMLVFTTLDGPTCRSKGSVMNLDVKWNFWTGCMVSVRGQYLPWSEVIPVERDGKIVFEPKPHTVIKVEKP